MSEAVGTAACVAGVYEHSTRHAPHKSTALLHAECGVMRLMAPPCALADATLSEGPTLQTNIVDANLDGLVIGQRVWVVFHERA